VKKFFIYFIIVNSLLYSDSFKKLFSKEIKKAKINNKIIMIIKTKKSTYLGHFIINTVNDIELNDKIERIYINNKNINFDNLSIKQGILFYNTNRNIYTNYIIKNFTKEKIENMIKFEIKFKEL